MEIIRRLDHNAAQQPKSHKNAKAPYLDYTAFSPSGLIEQLEFEGYPPSVAEQAVSSLSVDWDAQARQMARDYLDYSSFSRQGLIDQLVSEGFSRSTAQRAVSEVY